MRKDMDRDKGGEVEEREREEGEGKGKGERGGRVRKGWKRRWVGIEEGKWRKAREEGGEGKRKQGWGKERER